MRGAEGVAFDREGRELDAVRSFFGDGHCAGGAEQRLAGDFGGSLLLLEIRTRYEDQFGAGVGVGFDSGEDLIERLFLAETVAAREHQRTAGTSGIYRGLDLVDV